MDDVRLGITHVTNKAYVGKLDNFGLFTSDKVDVTEDFKRCVVTYCSEIVEFEVDGMRFKATCERID